MDCWLHVTLSLVARYAQRPVREVRLIVETLRERTGGRVRRPLRPKQAKGPTRRRALNSCDLGPRCKGVIRSGGNDLEGSGVEVTRLHAAQLGIGPNTQGVAVAQEIAGDSVAVIPVSSLVRTEIGVGRSPDTGAVGIEV